MWKVESQWGLILKVEKHNFQRQNLAKMCGQSMQENNAFYILKV